MPDIPITQARLAASIEIRLMVPVKLDFGLGVVFEFQPGLTLGSIGSMSRTQTREIYRRYAIGSYAHEPFDLIPGRITTDLKLEKIVLYSEYKIGNVSAPIIGQTDKTIYLSDGDLLGALGFVSGNLFNQQQPFAIEEVVHAPEGTGGQPTITSYLDCWLKTNPIEYDMMDANNQITIQSCDVACGRVVTSIPFDKAGAPIARKLITDAVSLI